MEDFPRRFGPYVLMKPLAHGGMGALCLAVHGSRGMEKLCVVKTALPHLHGSSYLQRFRDEAKIVVRLSHGNLVAVFDAGQVDGEIFLAMDFVEGKDLRAVWNRCAQKGIAFPVDVAVHIAKELARGLAYAHSFEGLSLVHRDVSPPNVLLSYTGETKLTDFGLASSTLKLEKTAPGVIYGKVSYMAPEQARGDALDARADLYGAGIILWELLTGRQLFPSAASRGGPARPEGPPVDDDLLDRVREPQVVAPSQRAARVPAELDRIVLRALATAPGDRYQTGEEFRSDLAAFQAKTAPSTDGDHVARFLRGLFGDVIDKERAERTALVVASAPLLGSSLPRPAERPANVPPPMPGTSASSSSSSEMLGPGDSRDKTKAEVVRDEPSEIVGNVLAGRYKIKRLSGEGGMGRVYEAEHIEIGKRVAVKVLHPAYCRMPEVVERFRREARAASKIGHPNIVNVTDSGTTDDGSFFFVMEYIEGVEVGLVIHREGPLPVMRALHITQQMCLALKAAHEAGVIHRDLKPENVLLVAGESEKDFVKVLDFGIAKSADVEETAKSGRRLTRPGVAMGTPEYMAPEQAAGKPADPRSDIYAVGSILYEMLTSVPPYDGDNVMEVLHKKANEAPRPLRELRPDVPEGVEELVIRAMARSPADRPQSMADLARDIQAMMTTLDDGLGLVPPAPPRRQTEIVAARVPPSSGLRALGLSRRTVAIAGALLMSLGVVVIIRGATASRPAPRVAGASNVPVKRAATAGPRAAARPAAPMAVTVVPAQPSEEPAAVEPAPARRVDLKAGRGKASAARGLSPDAANRLIATGNQQLALRHYDEAGATFTGLLGSKRDHGRAALGLAQVAFQQKRYTEMARRAKEAVGAGEGVPALVLLGDAHYKLRNYKDAVKVYDEALRRAPGNAGAQKGLQAARRGLD